MKKWGRRKADDLSQRWPKDENGEMIPAAYLKHTAGSELDIGIEINLLEAYGIPVLRKAVLDGDLGKVILGFSGPGEDLFVPETMLEKAKELLAAEPVEDDEESNECV